MKIKIFEKSIWKFGTDRIPCSRIIFHIQLCGKWNIRRSWTPILMSTCLTQFAYFLLWFPVGGVRLLRRAFGTSIFFGKFTFWSKRLPKSSGDGETDTARDSPPPPPNEIQTTTSPPLGGLLEGSDICQELSAGHFMFLWTRLNL